MASQRNKPGDAYASDHADCWPSEDHPAHSSNTGRPMSRHPVIEWLESELRPEFELIHQKLDNLCQNGAMGPSNSTGSTCASMPVTPPARLSEVLAGGRPTTIIRRATVHSASTVTVPPVRRQSLNSIRSNKSLQSVEGPHGPVRKSLDVPGPRVVRELSGLSGFSGVSGMTRQELDVAAAAILHRERCMGCLDTIWKTLEYPESSAVARWVAHVMPTFIIMTVFVTLSQTLDPPLLSGVPAAVIETLIDAIFLLEFVLRFAACPNRSAFFQEPYNIVDVISAVPLFFRAAIGFVLPEGNNVENISHGFLLFAVPIIRLLKTLRRFEKFHLLLRAFNLAIEALPVLLYMLFVITLIFAVLIYLVEPRDNIGTLGRAGWLTIVTMTTVGYGDVTPTSATGSVITGALIVITVLYMAVPLGIIGNAFTQTWNDRDRILLTQRTRDRLRQWGYEAHDIPILFQSGRTSEEVIPMGSNPGGALNIDEFRALLERMQVGFNDERIYKLFKAFGPTGNGTIDDKAFVRTLFPNAYHSIYHKGRDDFNCRRSQDSAFSPQQTRFSGSVFGRAADG